jgi:hypothetical protein
MCVVNPDQNIARQYIIKPGGAVAYYRFLQEKNYKVIKV